MRFVSRAQRSAIAVRCRPGSVTNAESGKAPGPAAHRFAGARAAPHPGQAARRLACQPKRRLAATVGGGHRAQINTQYQMLICKAESRRFDSCCPDSAETAAQQISGRG